MWKEPAPLFVTQIFLSFFSWQEDNYRHLYQRLERVPSLKLHWWRLQKIWIALLASNKSGTNICFCYLTSGRGYLKKKTFSFNFFISLRIHNIWQCFYMTCTLGRHLGHSMNQPCWLLDDCWLVQELSRTCWFLAITNYLFYSAHRNGCNAQWNDESATLRRHASCSSAAKSSARALWAKQGLY